MIASTALKVGLPSHPPVYKVFPNDDDDSSGTLAESVRELQEQIVSTLTFACPFIRIGKLVLEGIGMRQSQEHAR